MNSIRLGYASGLANTSWRFRRPTLSAEMLIGLSCLYFVVMCNHALWVTVLGAGAKIGFCLALALALAALHGLLIGPFLWGRSVRPMLAALVLLTSLASWHMDQYGVVFNTEMVRNVLETDPAEVRELISSSLVLHILLTGLAPALLIFSTRLRVVPWRQALRNRMLFLLAMILTGIVTIVPISKDLFVLFRNEHALRYQIAPGNILVGLARVTIATSSPTTNLKTPVATDARQISGPPSRKPRVLVLMLGETVRGDHWGLNGYERQTTPLLAARDDVVNFPDMSACGTSTAVSLPCIFSPFGRENYDRKAILDHETLVDVLSRNGVAVLWRDNQAGCKGVCNSVPTETMSASDAPELCRAGRCFDEILLQGLETRINAATGDLMIVLHPIGNHGPNYFERYPHEFDQFQPACHSTELSRCSREEIINAYDNAVLYADSIVARLIELLSMQDSHDASLVYVSDHGESLGEYGVYLHGAPYALAPKAQLHVPMLLWMSPESEKALEISQECLINSASQPHSHDDLFASVLGLFDVVTTQHRVGGDILLPCRRNNGLVSSTN